MHHRHFCCVVTLVLGACGDNLKPIDDPPDDPSAAAGFRGYAAVQDDLYVAFLEPESEFELHDYLGESGEQLSMLVGRADGFGVTFETPNVKPNSMNVLVWRMMLARFASDLAATCPNSTIVPAADPALVLNPRAAKVVAALCSWPTASERALGDAWDLVIGHLAPESSRRAWLVLATSPDLRDLGADDALPSLWLAALLHPAFLLEQ